MKGMRPRPTSESSVHGIIVSGEASESEEELDEITFTEEGGFTNIDSLYSREGIRTQPTPLNKVLQTHKSPHHQKLFESNILFRKSITSLVQGSLSRNAEQVSKLRSRLGPIYTKTNIANSALKKSRQNVAVLLDQLSILDHSNLPNRKLTHQH